jgi:dTDP-4-amino-4,6-dideoxygalactose transaminase
MIRLSKPSITKKEIDAVSRIMKQEYLGMGPETQSFEKNLSEYFGRSVICTSSGTSALHIAMDVIATNEPNKNEVLVPSLTFAASYQAISGAGLKPISCDINPSTGNICSADLMKKINKKTIAIMTVHYAGDPSGFDEVLKIGKKYKLRVVDDAAHAFGSKYKNKKIGSFGDITCFSFDGIKNITCGEGGAIISNDKKFLKRASDVRTLGIEGDSKRRYLKQRTWSFDIKSQGYRYHMSDMNAAIGVVQLKRLPTFIKKRQSSSKRYDKLFENSLNVSIFKRNYDEVTPHIYVVKLIKPKSRADLQDFLLKNNIQTGLHYLPNHLHSFYKNSSDKLKNVESIFPSLLTLPLHIDLKFSEQQLIVKKINEFYKK